MTTKELDALEYALAKANWAAKVFVNSEDGGTCNFDTPMINIKATKKQISQLDYKLNKCTWGLWKGWYFVEIPLSGQGNRRTRMAEAIARSLKNSGYETGVYYQVD